MVAGDLNASGGTGEGVGDLGEGGVGVGEALALVGEDRDGGGGQADQSVETRGPVLALVDDEVGGGRLVLAEGGGGLVGEGRPVEPAVLGARCAVAEVTRDPTVDGGGLDGGAGDREALEGVTQKLAQELGARQQRGRAAGEGEVDGAVRG
ncbi:hypothetical protein ABZ467_37280 [Streptomyces sp. NPDC005727]|uniref:hypothetical protein n=1 Tax=Streptomyces sp. NPDC005727 TaxID=3157053 RepID=UPI0033F97470